MPYKNKEQLYEAQRKHRNRNWNNLWNLLSISSCIDCGETDPIVLEFDHLPGNEKKFEIGRAVTGSTRSWATIELEISKCEIVCANCHKKRTAKRGNHRKYVMPS